jgi:predicted ester cyclase
MRSHLVRKHRRIATLLVAGALTSGGFTMTQASAATKATGRSNGTASGQGLTEEQARAIIAPWYSLFNVPGRGDVRTIAERVLTADYQSCSGNQPGECQGREAEIKLVTSFARTVPDMRWEIAEVLVAGDRVVVRGQQTGTPAGELFGVPHTGRSFGMMAVDIHTIKDGKIAKTFHVEDWRGALEQLRAQEGESLKRQTFSDLR